MLQVSFSTHLALLSTCGLVRAMTRDLVDLLAEVAADEGVC